MRKMKTITKGGRNMTSVIKINDIPAGLLAVISDSDKTSQHCYLNGMKITEIFIFKNRYRVNTVKGQYRYDLNSDITIEIY